MSCHRRKNHFNRARLKAQKVSFSPECYFHHHQKLLSPLARFKRARNFKYFSRSHLVRAHIPHRSRVCARYTLITPFPLLFPLTHTQPNKHSSARSPTTSRADVYADSSWPVHSGRRTIFQITDSARTTRCK